MQEIDVLGRVCARLLHDLVGPVGAIGNGVELAEELGPEPETLALIASSAEKTAQRLKLYRLAYGAGGRGASVSFDVCREALEPVLAEKKLSLKGGAGLPQAEGLPRVLTMFCLALAEAAPRGGEIDVSYDGEYAVTLVLSGDRISAQPLSPLLEQGNAVPDERGVPAHVAHLYAGEIGAEITGSVSDTGAILKLTVKG